MSKSVFPFVQAAILGAWVAGSLLSQSVYCKMGHRKSQKNRDCFVCDCGIRACGCSLIMPKDPYATHFVGMLFYAFGANWIIGLYFPEGMEILPNIKGITASLLTSARLLIAAMVIGISSALYNATVYPLAVVILATIVVIFADSDLL